MEASSANNSTINIKITAKVLLNFENMLPHKMCWSLTVERVNNVIFELFSLFYDGIKFWSLMRRFGANNIISINCYHQQSSMCNTIVYDG